MSDRLPPLALAAELGRIIGIDGEDWTNEEFDKVEAAAATIRDLNDLAKAQEELLNQAIAICNTETKWTVREHALERIAELKRRLKYGETA